MKKIWSYLTAVLFAFGFTACEDVPAPYEINDGGDTEIPGMDDILLDEDFSATLGSFQSVSKVGNFPWAVSYGCAQVTSYQDTDGDGQKDNNEAETWLVSKQFSMAEVDTAHISFDYILRYANSNQMESHYQVLASKDYAGGKIEGSHWTVLPVKLVQGADWDTWYNCSVELPAEFRGAASVTVALMYKATTKAATWEVKNFRVKKGAVKNEGGEAETVKELPYSEAFSSTLGGFTNYTTDGAGEWIIDFSTAKATGYDNASQVTTAGTYYLVSPEISLKDQTEVHVVYEYILRYLREDANQQFLITSNFDAANPTANWTVLKQDHTEGRDWTNFSKADLQIPADFLGKTVRVAFRYSTDAVSGSTWEVKNFSIQAGKVGGETGGGETEGDLTAPNGDFEAWVDGKPNNWVTASSAGNATLTQSTDARSGKYSVCVGGYTSANKRLGYKETELKAGEYTMTFYVKAVTAAGASVRPGYVPVKGGSVGSYVYSDEYVNNIPNTEWVKVEHTFTLAADGTYSVVIMNSKNPGQDVLVDDFTLTAADGIVIVK